MKAHNLYTIIPVNDQLIKLEKASSAKLYYKSYSIDLLTGEKILLGIGTFLNSINFPLEKLKQNLRVIHLFYELGFLFEEINLECIEDVPLAIDIQYQSTSEFKIKLAEKIKLVNEVTPEYSHYEEAFNRGYAELKQGNCYQFNLTGFYQYRFDKETTASDFISALWREKSKRGAYASATYSSYLQKLYLSNSPECLFQFSKGKLLTRPIKGTLKINPGDSIEELWKKLKADKKSQAELYMITDLLRNDLSRIELPRSIVTKKKARLLVPGLMHQYSEIMINLGPSVTLKRVLEKIYPGGSITGAPKKNVMKILFDLERRSRGFYCGSTLILNKGSARASINIRSSEIDFQERRLIYQAGGGITLLSDVKEEYLEMTYKHHSYFDTLTL